MRLVNRRSNHVVGETSDIVVYMVCREIMSFFCPAESQFTYFFLFFLAHKEAVVHVLFGSRKWKTEGAHVLGLVRRQSSQSPHRIELRYFEAALFCKLRIDQQTSVGKS
jgi:hypothetical protein